MATVIKGPKSVLSGGGAANLMAADKAKVGILKRKSKPKRRTDAAVVNRGKESRG